MLEVQQAQQVSKPHTLLNVSSYLRPTGICCSYDDGAGQLGKAAAAKCRPTATMALHQDLEAEGLADQPVREALS